MHTWCSSSESAEIDPLNIDVFLHLHTALMIVLLAAESPEALKAYGPCNELQFCHVSETVDSGKDMPVVFLEEICVYGR